MPDLRHEWTFPISAAHLRVAVAKRLDHHAARLDHWRGELDRLKTALLERGVTIEETPADFAIYSNTTRPGLGVRVDDELMGLTRHAQEKTREHMAHIDDYSRYHRALSHVPDDRSFDLRIGDLEFFGL